MMFGRRARAKVTRRQVAGVAGAVMAVALLTAGMGSSATERSTSSAHGLYSYVVATNRGPLHVGDVIHLYMYVANTNPITNGGGQRNTLPNAYVVNSVDYTTTVDGALYTTFTYTLPPYPSYRPYAGHWASTVTCPADGPCNIVGNPGVLPLENAAAFYTGWGHGSDELDGRYVFTFVVHGTLNGESVDLTANSPAVQMVR